MLKKFVFRGANLLKRQRGVCEKLKINSSGGANLMYCWEMFWFGSDSPPTPMNIAGGRT